MIRREILPRFVTLTEAHATIAGPLKGMRYDVHECFVVHDFVVNDIGDFVSCEDSSGNVVHLPAVILDKAEVCPWKQPMAI